MGLLAGYSNFGMTAIFIFYMLPFIQDFAMTAILPISVCYVFEASHSRVRNILCNAVLAGATLGLLLSRRFASRVLYKIHNDAAYLLSIGYFPYLLVFSITFCILYSVYFIIPPKLIQHPSPKLFALKKQWHTVKQLVRLGLVRFVFIIGFIRVCSGTVLYYLPFYLCQSGNLPKTTISFLGDLSLFLRIPFLLLSGYLSTLVNYKRLLFWHTVGMILFIYPLFSFSSDAPVSVLVVIYVLLSYIVSSLESTMMMLLVFAYPDSIRFSGMVMTYLLANMFFDEMNILSRYMGLVSEPKTTLAPVFYVIILGCIVLPLLWKLPKSNSAEY